MKKCLPFLFTLCVMLFSWNFVHAQNETTGSINGIVTDAGGTIAGATVVARHEPSGSVYKTTTRQDGRYNLPSIRIGGPYTISVSYVGFKTQIEIVQKLALGQDYAVNVKLSNDNTTLNEVAIVGKQNKVFNSSRTGAAQNISRTQIDNLPTLSRSFVDFVKLTPQFSSQLGNPSFAGRSNLANNFTIDGALFNNAFGLQGTIGSQTNSQPINMDAFEEISVNIAPYDVRQSGFTGAAINAVTKSGTNEYQGSLNGYYRNQDLVSEKIYTGVKSPVSNFNLKGYGFTFGGPIIKNKLFFFLSGELERRIDPGTNYIASRGGNTGANIARVKGEDLDALSSYLKTLGYDPGAYENYPLNQRSDKFSAKIDYNIDSKNTLSLKYFYFRSFKDILPSNAGAPIGGRQPSQASLPFQSAGYGINNNMDNLNLEFRTRFNNKISNQVTLGYNRMRDYRESKGGTPFPFVDILGAGGSSYTAFGYEPFTAFNKLNTDVIQFTDNLNIYAGAHQITVGVNFEHYKTLNGFSPNYYGNYTFNSLADFYDSAKGGPSKPARYQVQYSLLPDGSFPYATIKSSMFGLYAQDAYAVSNELKVTAGLRVDLPVISTGQVQTNQNVANLTFANGEKIDVSKYPKNALLWSPRVGFNWNVNNEGLTQVRGGTGIFTGRPPLVWISNQAGNNGVQFGSENTPNPDNRPFTPNVDAYRNLSHATAATNSSYNLAVTANNFKYPQVWRSNLAVDQKLPGGITATFEALYSKDLNAVYFRNANLNESAYTALSGADNRPRYTSPKIYGGVGGATPQNPNISEVVVMDNSSKGYSYTLTGTIQKEFKGGFYATAGYTFTDSRSVNDGGTVAQNMWRDRYVSGSPNTDVLSYSNFMVRNRFIASFAYRKEYIQHLGTTISLFYQLQNGPRNSYTYNGDVNNDGLVINDLIYVPAKASDIVLVADNAADKRTPAQLWAQLNSYISQDGYLSSRRGKYAERNGLVNPLIGTLDLRIAQDLFASFDKKKHSLQLTFDIFNLGNLINTNWGVAKFANRANGLLAYKGMAADGKTPTFSFPYLDDANQVPLVNTFSNAVDENSRWRIQLGLRYRFNQ